MARIILTLAACCLLASAAPPSPHTVFPTPQHQQKYLVDFADEPPAYYNQILQKQDYQSSPSQYQASPSQYQPGPGQQNGAPSRLETFEDPNNQVELIQPQQTPQQQNPAAPNVPGIAPGQRVYIIHMPVPGYRPGTVGGYQPVYVVAAAPNGNPNVQGNGIQNPVYQDANVIPLIGGRFGFPGVPQQGGYAGVPQQPGYAGVGQQQGFLIGGVAQQGNPGLLVGGSPYNLYQQPLVYQPVALQVPQGQNPGSVRLHQYVGLQAGPQPAAAPVHQSAQLQQQNAESKRLESGNEDSKESAETPRRAPHHAPLTASKQ